MESGHSRFQFHIHDLRAQVKRTAEIFKPQLFRQKFSLNLVLPPHPVQLRYDEDTLSQALTNLLDNAIKYSGKAREITIRIDDLTDAVLLLVSDRGIGVRDQEKALLMEGFFRGQEAAAMNPGGVGLGLKIVKHIMDEHNGEVVFESNQQGGTTVTLRFPKP